MKLCFCHSLILSVVFSSWLPAFAADPISAETKVECLAVLRAGMRAADFWPSMHAAEALSITGHKAEVRDYLHPRLKTESDDQKRCGLARELVRAGELLKWIVLLDILNDTESEGRVHAAESMYKVGWQGDEGPLQRAMSKENDIHLRIMAAAALAKYGRGEVKTTALKFLRVTLRDEQDPQLFRISAWVLGSIGEAADLDLIRRRLPDTQEDRLSRAFLEHAMALFGDPAGKEALLANLESDDPAVRAYAAVSAGESRLFEATPALVRQLKDENLDARIRAAQALLLLTQ